MTGALSRPQGHGQGCITKEQMETVLGSLAVGEVQIDRPVLEEGHESWLAKKRAARRFKKEEKRSKAREKKELTFVDFLAILTVWTRARDSRSLADLRYHKHRVLFDMRADWMLNRMLWVAIFLSAFFAFPYSFVTKLLGDVARDWAEGGMDQVRLPASTSPSTCYPFGPAVPYSLSLLLSVARSPHFRPFPGSQCRATLVFPKNKPQNP